MRFRSPALLRRSGSRNFTYLFLLIAAGITIAQEQPKFFLPQNPVAAAYVLGRLSNRELMEAPRGEFVYIALLQRKGLDKKYRLEALDGLANIHHADRLVELIHAIEQLDQKGADAQESLHDLGSLLVQSTRNDLAAKRAQCESLAFKAQLSQTRQIGFAACVIAAGSTGTAWTRAKENPALLADLVLAVPLIPSDTLRAPFYSEIKPLLSADPPELRRAAIAAIVAIPGRDQETFGTLAGLIQSGKELPSCIGSLERLPHASWAKDQLEPLAKSIVAYLEKIPAEERTQASFTQALQLATDLAASMPTEAQRALTRTLRNIGPTIVTLHAVYEQMRFDRDLIVIETAKPVVITLQNDDAMPHNLAILVPGSLKEIGQAAEKMPPEPDSEGRLYVPANPKVLHATRLVTPGQKLQLAFDAPSEPGDYEFTCTFPGHWLRMAGTLRVVPDLDAYLASHATAQTPKLTEWKLADFSDGLSQADAGGNLAAGRELFSKLACVQCHKLGSSGYAFGPDLSDVFKRYKNDRAAVLLQILEPSKIIADRYRNFNFDLKSGDSVLGVIVKEDNETVTIQTGPADSLIQVIKKTEIQQQRPLASSPMPVGLLSSLSKKEVFDLLAFLQSGGFAAHDHH